MKNLLKYDVRILQIVIMASLLLGGILFVDFTIRPEQILLTLLAGFTTQFVFLKIYGLKDVGYLSTFITCMGLSLLLRSNHTWVHPLVCFIVISAKFLIRYKGKHLFNPAMFGVIIGIYIMPNSWISPGQWGHELMIVFWLMSVGLIVALRSQTLILSVSFLGFYFGLLALRILYMGYKWDVWLHQFESGALLLFSFFMITDPKTSPNHTIGRIVHTGLVAFLAFIWQYYFYFNGNLIHALFFSSIFVPLWDKIWEKELYTWNLRSVS